MWEERRRVARVFTSVVSYTATLDSKLCVDILVLATSQITVYYVLIVVSALGGGCLFTAISRYNSKRSSGCFPFLNNLQCIWLNAIYCLV